MSVCFYWMKDPFSSVLIRHYCWYGSHLLDTRIELVAWCFFPFSLSSPSSLLCSSAAFWTAACFSWLPLRNVSRHWITGSHLLWFQTYFKPIKSLSCLSCGVPTPAWFPEAQTYLGKGSKMPKYLLVHGLSFFLAVPLQGTVLRMPGLHRAARACGRTQHEKGTWRHPVSLPRLLEPTPLPKAICFQRALGIDGVHCFQCVDSYRHSCPRYP